MLTLTSFPTVHREVCWLVSLEPRLLHSRPIDLDFVWMTTLSNQHLPNSQCTWDKSTTAAVLSLYPSLSMIILNWLNVKVCICALTCVLPWRDCWAHWRPPRWWWWCASWAWQGCTHTEMCRLPCQWSWCRWCSLQRPWWIKRTVSSALCMHYQWCAPVNKQWRFYCNSSYLCVNLEVTLSSHASINGEFSWFVHNDASWS